MDIQPQATGPADQGLRRVRSVQAGELADNLGWRGRTIKREPLVADWACGCKMR